MLVQVEIQKSHIAGPAATKLHGLVVMMLGWHAEGPGFKSRSDPLKLLHHNSRAPSIGRNAKVKNKAGKVLTLDIGLKSIFRSLISSSKNQTTKTLILQKNLERKLPLHIKLSHLPKINIRTEYIHYDKYFTWSKITTSNTWENQEPTQLYTLI